MENTMSLRHLKIFIAVYETASFTGAGKRLRLAQPAVSLAVRELEEEYGVPLFDRVRHRIRPTAQGERLYEYALHIFTLLDEMQASVRDDEAPGDLRIGSSMTIGSEILPDLLVRYRTLRPHIRTQVTVANYHAVEEAILQNRIDFGLIETEADHPRLASLPFMEDALCAIAAPHHPLSGGHALSLEEISGEPFLARESGSSIRDLVESVFTAAQLPFHPLWESASPQAILSAAQHGFGIAVLPRRLAHDALRAGRLCELQVPALQIRRRCHIIYYQDKYVPPHMKDFFDLCLSLKSHSETDTD
ncbi:MAG: LysR family transcriptional regulator [Eubacteriales bacterium]|nr:LysR family transcriptional regulator [Eubacteriales bacterium]